MAIGTPALAAWLQCLASNVCEMLQDHKPEVEAAWGRLSEEQLFRDNKATYLTSGYRVGNGYWDPPHRLALSRSVGDFDLTSETHHAQNVIVIKHD